jgi:hypothetical protein
MEVDRPIFADAVWQIAVFVPTVALDNAQIVHLAVDLVGRRIDEEAFRAFAADGIEHVECAERVVFKVFTRVCNRSGNRNLSGQVQHRAWPRFVHDPLHRAVIADVSMLETNLLLASQPIEILRRATSRKIVENGHGPAPFVKVARRIDADESGASRNQYRFHAALSVDHADKLATRKELAAGSRGPRRFNSGKRSSNARQKIDSARDIE